MKRFKAIIAFFFMAWCIGHAGVLPDIYEYGSNEITQIQKDYDFELVRKAEYKLLETLKTYPDNVSGDLAVLINSNIDLLSGNYNIAKGRLTEFIKVRPNSPFVSYAALQRGYIAFEQKEYTEAEEYFKTAVELAEKDLLDRQDDDYYAIAHEALYWRGISLNQNARYQEAIEVFETAANKYPNGDYADDALFALGQNHEINKFYQNAIDKYTDLEKRYPYSNCIIASGIRKANNKLILRDFTGALLALERTENIIEHIRDNTEEGEKYPEQDFSKNSFEKILYLRGESYNLSGNYAKAAEVFRTFLETIYGSEIENYVRLGAGWAHLHLENFSKALEYYDSVIDKAGPDDFRVKATAQLYRIVALKNLGDKKQAKKELAALSVQPTYPYLGQVLLELGQMQYEEGDYEKARRTLERAEREAYDALVLVRVHLLLGASYMEMGIWSKSVNSYKNAEELASRANIIFMPQKEWYLAESRLKQGIALVMADRSAEAIPVLITYTGTAFKDSRIDEGYFWLAEAYYNTDLLNNSAETYQKIIDKYPRSSRREEAYYGMGWSYFRQQKFSRSSDIFETMIQEFPNSKHAVEVYTRQGDGYYWIKNYKLAAQSYDKASRMNTGSDEVQYSAYQRAHCLYMLHEYESAVTALLQFVRRFPRTKYAPYALNLIGKIRFHQGKYDEAIQDYEFMIEAYPDSELLPDAYYNIADAYYNKGDFQMALNQYKFVWETYPTHGLANESLKSMEYCLLALGREDEAVEILQNYIEKNPDSRFSEGLSFKKADMFYTGRRYKDAVAEYDDFITKYPDSKRIPEVLYQKAQSYISMNEKGDATKTFDRIVSDYPQSEYAPIALLEHGIMEAQGTDMQAADSIFTVLQEKYPTHESSAQAGFERAIIKYNTGDTLAAIEMYKGVAAAFDSLEYGLQSRYLVAKYYKSKEWNDSARTEYRILATQNNNLLLAAEAQYRLGEIYMREKNLDSAIVELEVLKEKFAGYEDWYSYGMLALGECYENTSQFQKAEEIYTVLLEVRIDDDFAKTAKQRLKRIAKMIENQKQEEKE